MVGEQVARYGQRNEIQHDARYDLVDSMPGFQPTGKKSPQAARGHGAQKGKRNGDNRVSFCRYGGADKCRGKRTHEQLPFGTDIEKFHLEWQGDSKTGQQQCRCPEHDLAKAVTRAKCCMYHFLEHRDRVFARGCDDCAA